VERNAFLRYLLDLNMNITHILDSLSEERPMKYLITGATGDVGSRVVQCLIKRGIRPRVFVRNQARAEQMFGGRAEIAIGDLGDKATLRAALEGIDSLFLLNSGPLIPELDLMAATAAKSAGVGHIVKLSSIDVEQSLAIGAWHEKGEAAIRESGIPFTFVRPTGFMSNLLAWAHSIKTDGVIRTSTGEGRRPFIHSADIAEVAVAALTSEMYRGATLAITGPQALTFAEAASKIGSAIGKSILYESISDEEAAARFAAATGASAEEVEAHKALWRAIREGRLGTVTDTVERVLGRPPIGLDAWIKENSAAFA
jgi:uncharacterized protein YbjT (DUF2867 family)